MKSRILILEDDPVFLEKLAAALEGMFSIDKCQSVREFNDKFAVGRYELLILDMRLEQEREGLDVLKEVLSRDPLQGAVMITAYADIESYTETLAAGALSYFDKREFSPLLIARAIEAILRQAQLRRRLSAAEEQLDDAEPLEIVGSSASMVHLREQVRDAAEDGKIPVLLVGEVGSGKRLAARNIHRFSRRLSEGRFISMPLWRLPPPEILGRIFGYVHRLDRGKVREIPGIIDEAKGGMLFLNDLSQLKSEVSREFLSLASQGSFLRRGGDRPIVANIQMVFADAAPPVDFSEALARGKGMTISVPSLRDRPGDILLTAQYLLQRQYQQGRSRCRSFRSTAVSLLESHRWPGNVRELKATVEYAAILADGSGSLEIGPEHLPMSVLQVHHGDAIPTESDYRENMARAELTLVENAISRLGITKQADLSRALGYGNRFILPRRLREHFKKYPRLASDFPYATSTFLNRRRKP